VGWELVGWLWWPCDVGGIKWWWDGNSGHRRKKLPPVSTYRLEMMIDFIVTVDTFSIPDMTSNTYSSAALYRMAISPPDRFRVGSSEPT
jgi:hypothetical protein